MTDDEINAAVAERIMGWHESRSLSPVPCWRDAGERFVMEVGDWTPATNMAQAWQVVERAMALGWSLELSSPGRHRSDNADSYHQTYWMAWLEQQGKKSAWGQENSPARAICRSVLRAVEGSGGDSG